MSDNEKAMYELTLHVPGSPKGEPIQIPGLGTFENGYSYEVSKSDAEAYRTYHMRQEDVVDDDGNVVGSEAVPGPTLLQAFDSSAQVTVSTVKPSSGGGGSSGSGSNSGSKPPEGGDS